jgi:hypothetical protein
MARYCVIHDIFEPFGRSEGRYPIVTHIFRGDTPEQADGYYRAHRRTDAFLRACDDSGRFGRIVCYSRVRRTREG